MIVNLSVDNILTNDVSGILAGDTENITSISKSLTSLRENAFNGYTNLKSVTLPNTLTSIGSTCFTDCTNLSSIDCEFTNIDVVGAPWGATNATINYLNDFLLSYVSAGTMTSMGITVTIDNAKTITVDGTNTSSNTFIKFTGSLEINSTRPTSWDTNAPIIYPASSTKTLKQSTSIISGTYTVPGTEGINMTTRFSTASIFLNSKMSDGVFNVTGVPTSNVTMGVLYIRKASVVNNLRIAVSLTEV